MIKWPSLSGELYGLVPKYNHELVQQSLKYERSAQELGLLEELADGSVKNGVRAANTPRALTRDLEKLSGFAMRVSVAASNWFKHSRTGCSGFAVSALIQHLPNNSHDSLTHSVAVLVMFERVNYKDTAGLPPGDAIASAPEVSQFVSQIHRPRSTYLEY